MGTSCDCGVQSISEIANYYSRHLCYLCHTFCENRFTCLIVTTTQTNNLYFYNIQEYTCRCNLIEILNSLKPSEILALYVFQIS